ncbi:MAG TPA: hypothetical protein VM307_10520 [Egibacteraceae bacterium]|nr:hypothetical protein [Egibacteraceae bacterium]
MSRLAQAARRQRVVRMRRAGLLAGFAAALATGMTAVIAAAAVTQPGRTYAAFSGGTAADELPGVVVNCATSLLGALIIARRPDNIVGRALAVIGVGFLSTPFVAVTVLSLPLSPAVAAWLAWPGNWVWTLGQAGVVIMLFTFPTGRALTRRWRSALNASLVGIALITLVSMLAPGPLDAVPALVNPVGVGALDGVFETLLVVFAVSTIAGVAALIVRFVRSTGEERLQLRWVAFGAGVFVTMILAQAVPGMPDLGVLDLSGVLILLGAVTVAVTKYRLYEIDRLISRTLSYALLTAMLIALYLGSVTVLTTLTAPITRESPLAVAAATLLAAAAFQPLRRRIQHAVDRRFNRGRFDAAQTVAAYRARLRDDLDLDALAVGLVEVVGEAVEPSDARLWLRPQPGVQR